MSGKRAAAAACVAVLCLAIGYALCILLKLPTIGTVHGPENRFITIGSRTYVNDGSGRDGLSSSDRGMYLGCVSNGRITMRVFDVKGNDGFIYALWDWEGGFYVLIKL